MKKQSLGAPRKKEEGTTISLRLQRQQLTRLDEYASQAGTTRSALIQMAIARFLKEGL